MRHVPIVFPSDLRLHPNKQQPKDDCGQANAFLRVNPHELYPNICRCHEEDPLNWDEEQADQITGDGDADEKKRECLKAKSFV